MKSRELLFSVTIKDCEVQTFRCGGPGGQKVNKTSSGVRVIHPPSGAVGVGREYRSQGENKVEAFRRMAESLTFQLWAKRTAFEMMGEESVETKVEKMMDGRYLKIECREDGKWIPYCEDNTNENVQDTK